MPKSFITQVKVWHVSISKRLHICFQIKTRNWTLVSKLYFETAHLYGAIKSLNNLNVKYVCCMQSYVRSSNVADN